VRENDAAPRRARRPVRAQAGDHVLGAARCWPRQEDALLAVEALHTARRRIDLAVDPDFAVVVDIGLEGYAGAGNGQAVQGLRQLNRRAVPGESHALGDEVADVGADL